MKASRTRKSARERTKSWPNQKGEGSRSNFSVEVRAREKKVLTLAFTLPCGGQNPAAHLAKSPNRPLSSQNLAFTFFAGEEPARRAAKPATVATRRIPIAPPKKLRETVGAGATGRRPAAIHRSPAALFATFYGKRRLGSECRADATADHLIRSRCRTLVQGHAAPLHHRSQHLAGNGAGAFIQPPIRAQPLDDAIAKDALDHRLCPVPGSPRDAHNGGASGTGDLSRKLARLSSVKQSSRPSIPGVLPQKPPDRPTPTRSASRPASRH